MNKSKLFYQFQNKEIIDYLMGKVGE